MTDNEVDLVGYLRNPVGTLKRARARGPIASSLVAPVALTYDLANEILGSTVVAPNLPESLRAVGIDSGPFYEWMVMGPLGIDGDYHRRWRRLSKRTFTPRRSEALRPRVRQTADDLVLGFRDRGQCELMGDFADVLPVAVLCELIGIPPADREQARQWANGISYGFNPAEAKAHIHEVDTAISGLLDYALDLVRERRQSPQEDLVSSVAVVGPAEGFSDDEIAALIATLIFTGHETVKLQIGWSVLWLLQRAERWDWLYQNPEHAEAVAERCLQYRSAVSNTTRRAKQACTFGGHAFAEGDQVIVSLWSANDDVTPSEEDGTALAATHLAFGFGAHHCLGAALARVELQEVLLSLTTLLCDVRRSRPLSLRPPVGVSGPDSLHLQFAPRPGPQGDG